MNVKHPDGKRIIVMVAETSQIAEIEILNYEPRHKLDKSGSEIKRSSEATQTYWISLGYVGQQTGGVLVESSEWDAFVALIKETDEIVQGLRKENNNARKTDETFEQYKSRRAADSEATKQALQPRMFWESDRRGTYRKLKENSK